jgi:hypothetical protein
MQKTCGPSSSTGTNARRNGNTNGVRKGLIRPSAHFPLNCFAENLFNCTSPLKSQDPRYHLQRRDQKGNERCDRDYRRTSKTFIHPLVCQAVERFRPHTAYTSSSRPRILVAYGALRCCCAYLHEESLPNGLPHSCLNPRKQPANAPLCIHLLFPEGEKRKKSSVMEEI